MTTLVQFGGQDRHYQLKQALLIYQDAAGAAAASVHDVTFGSGSARASRAAVDASSTAPAGATAPGRPVIQPGHPITVTAVEHLIHSLGRGAKPGGFTEPRRVATDKMRMKYGGEPEINMPFPPAESSPANVPDADADGCQFLTRADGVQAPCNAPATRMRQNGFRYCAAHAEAVQRDLQRLKKTMHLLNFKP